MNFQAINSELTSKAIWLANLQRNLMENQNAINEKKSEENPMKLIATEQQPHPFVVPSLNASSQNISAMLNALAPLSILNSIVSSTNTLPLHQSISTSKTNNTNSRMINPTTNVRSNGSGFGWGSRERKMDENWRTQLHKNI